MSAPKKSKVESPAQYLQPRVLTDEFREKLRNEVKGSKPYEHGVINNLLDNDLLKTARKEIFDNIQFTEKETDIYKLVQTGDLLNLDGLPEDEIALLKNVLKLRDALYSKEFRDVMSYVTQSGPLSGKRFDLSLNNYNKGCHLMAHDDVIGTRVISFILYLVPPEYEWKPKYGGALQLYSTVSEGIPEVDHCVSLPPQFNQLSFFKIIPGHSFHDVEEVYVDKPRLSIQGWFHAPQEGEENYEGPPKTEGNREKSTLSQLSHAHYENDGYLPKREFTEFKELGIMDNAIDEYLTKFISPEVLNNIEKLREEFTESNMLNIQDFLSSSFWDRIQAEVNEMELAKCPMHTKDVAAGWSVASPPHLRRYCYLEDPKGEEKLSALQELKVLFQSKAFAKLLDDLTAFKPITEHVELRRFRPGRDYTLASVSGVEKVILEAVLSITTAKWDDDVGGYDLVMGGGYDENDDPAVYRAADEDDDSVLISETPKKNELILIARDPDLLRFTKYVSKNAKGSRWDVLGQYVCEEDDEEEEEEEEDKQGKN